MSHFISVELPGDLPENWTTSQYVAPEGLDVGLSEKHGYNYLCRQINAAQSAALSLSRIACSGYENLVDNWYFEDPINTAGGYCVLTGTKYYRESTLTTLVNTTTSALVAQYVNATYGTITVGSTQYYVAAADVYEGYASGSRVFTFDRWYGLGATVTKDKSRKGLTIVPASPYAPAQFFQAIADPIRLSSKQITYSILVESVSGKVNASILRSDYADATITTDLSSMQLSAGMNTRTYTLPAGIGTTNSYLIFSISVPKGASVTIKAVKIQIGSRQTLAYDDGNSWEFVQLPNRVEETLKCVGAPVELGGKGIGSLTHLVVDATIE